MISKKNVILILIINLFSNFISISVVTYTPPLLTGIGVAPSFITLIVSIIPLTLLIFPPILGKISDKIQNRIVFTLVGFIIIPFMFILISLTQNLALISLYLFLYGFLAACSNFNYVLFQELVHNEQKMVAFYNAITVLGWFLGAQIFGLFIEFSGYSILFPYLAVFAIINGVLTLFLRENRPLIIDFYEKLNTEVLNTNVSIQKKEDHVSSSVFYGIFLRNFGVRPVYAVIAVIMGFYITNSVEIGFLIGINFLIQFFLMLAMGKFLKPKHFKIVITIGYLLSSLALLGYTISTDFLGFLFYQVIISLSFAMFFTPSQIHVAHNSTTENKGKYNGFLNTGNFAGSFFGILLFSGLLSYFDYFSAIYLLIIFPILAAIIIFVNFKQTAKKERKN